MAAKTSNLFPPDVNVENESDGKLKLGVFFFSWQFVSFLKNFPFINYNNIYSLFTHETWISWHIHSSAGEWAVLHQAINSYDDNRKK